VGKERKKMLGKRKETTKSEKRGKKGKVRGLVPGVGVKQHVATKAGAGKRAKKDGTP